MERNASSLMKESFLALEQPQSRIWEWINQPEIVFLEEDIEVVEKTPEVQEETTEEEPEECIPITLLP